MMKNTDDETYRIFLCITVVFMLAIALAACGKKGKLEGIWIYSGEGISDDGYPEENVITN